MEVVAAEPKILSQDRRRYRSVESCPVAIRKIRFIVRAYLVCVYIPFTKLRWSDAMPRGAEMSRSGGLYDVLHSEKQNISACSPFGSKSQAGTESDLEAPSK